MEGIHTCSGFFNFLGSCDMFGWQFRVFHRKIWGMFEQNIGEIWEMRFEAVYTMGFCGNYPIPHAIYRKKHHILLWFKTWKKTIYTYNILQWTGRERSAHLLAALQTENEVGGCGVMGQHFFGTTSEVASAGSKRAQVGYFRPLPMYLRDFERCFSHYLSPNISKPSWKWVKNQVRTGQVQSDLLSETLRWSTLGKPQKIEQEFTGLESDFTNFI